MNAQLKELLQKEMTRHEFLAMVGFGLASVFGLSSILRLLGAHKPSSGSSSHFGYGSGGYGR